MSQTIIPKFDKGQKVFTRFGREITIEAVEVDVYITYVAANASWSESELRADKPVGCAHRGPDGSYYGVSSPPDEMDYEFVFCPLCAVRLAPPINNGIL